MPLDSAAYLTSLGWQGAGSGLRKDGMIKPLAIPQKRTLAGVGKDRDEAFPFWDHVFNAAANSIKIKIHNDSDPSDTESEQTNGLESTLPRTATGIISSRRPIIKTQSSPRYQQSTGSSYPADKPRLSLLAEAKRQAAYARLYAAFYRGFVIRPLDEQPEFSDHKADKRNLQKAVIQVNHDTHIDIDQDITNSSHKKNKSFHQKCREESVKKENYTPATRTSAKIEPSQPQGSAFEAQESSKKAKKKRRKGSFEDENLCTSKDITEPQCVSYNRAPQQGNEAEELPKGHDGTNVDLIREENRRKKKKKQDKNPRAK